jgi:hypothetical protein
MGGNHTQGRTKRARIPDGQEAVGGPKVQPLTASTFERLLELLSQLETREIAYTLGHYRPEAVMVTLALPGERWEVEFLADGSVDVERFVSTGELGSDEALRDLLAAYAG